MAFIAGGRVAGAFKGAADEAEVRKTPWIITTDTIPFTQEA
jgi:hypothetical protein